MVESAFAPSTILYPNEQIKDVTERDTQQGI